MQFECIFSWGFGGVNPLRHRCAMPPPPKGGGFTLQTGRCKKLPPRGSCRAYARLRGFVPLQTKPPEHPQTLRCPRIINVFPLKMPKATRRAFKSLYPPKGAQDHIRSISASTSSMRVAQLVAMRTTVWVSSNFSQKPNLALPSSAVSWAFSSTRKIWFVGESIKKR